jgi:hypothetical protein
MAAKRKTPKSKISRKFQKNLKEPRIVQLLVREVGKRRESEEGFAMKRAPLSSLGEPFLRASRATRTQCLMLPQREEELKKEV